MASPELPLYARKVAFRMEELSLSQADLARRTGLTRQYISDLLGGKKKSIKPAKLSSLATALGVPVHYFHVERLMRPVPRSPVDLTGKQRFSEDVDVVEDEDADRPLGDLLARHLFNPFVTAKMSGGFIPLFEPNLAGRTAITLTSAGAVRRPPLLANSVGCYAVLADERMKPRYLAGELLYAAPESWPKHGDYVHLVRRSEVGLLGETCRLVFIAKSYVEIEFYAPINVVRIPIGTIKYIHRIVMSGCRSLVRS